MTAVIEVEGLRKEYRHLRRGKTVAVDGLSFSVPSGGVFGFLGPNGSGKTTTIRCLLGLIVPTAGRCRILGVDSRTELPRVIARVGSIVEAPAFFPGFSGRKNLRLLAGMYGIPNAAVDAALDRVGLAERARDLYKNYSLGMKQRLAIGATLLKEPELLILDEPANGLDPGGIKEVRELLRRLADEGRTVFVSSHILSEVQQICDHVAILTRGRCVTAGPVGEVLRSRKAAGLIVRAPDLGKALDALQAAGFDAAMDGDCLRVATDPSEGASVTQALARKRIYLSELRPDEVSLETVFLELTEENELGTSEAEQHGAAAEMDAP